ncbi:MAG: glycosyltransferase family 2 protein [Anaerolineae bacterium]|nr:glycosyltransferase family 2 protein [Anaerolineae bacterium]
MRIGQNPAKKANTVAKPERITVAVLNYIPVIGGFFSEMPDVLKICLTSIRQHTDLPFDLLVFDNGSCEEVTQYLADEKNNGNIQYLILSEKNLGKGGAWNMILSGAPGEIIAYSDNDIYYRKGWLSHSLRLLETYPNVGMVTARPFRSDMAVCSATLAWAANTPDVVYEEGSFIRWEDYRDFNMSIGNSEEELRTYFQQSVDRRMTFRDQTAFVGASHWQFLAYKTIFNPFLPFSMERPMGQVKHLDQQIDAQGYLRLMTPYPYAVNISNSLQHTPEIPPEFVSDVLGNTNHASGRDSNTSFVRRMLDVDVVKRFFMKLYNLIFDWYIKND